MAVNFPNGFNITGKEAVDTRLILSKAEMLAVKKARMPDVYFAVCKDDGFLYLYKSTNKVNSQTGRFRIIQTSDNSQWGQLGKSDEDE